jgi:hypothetical protein
MELRYHSIKNFFIANNRVSRLSLEVKCPTPSITTIEYPVTELLNPLIVCVPASSNAPVVNNTGILMSFNESLKDEQSNDEETPCKLFHIQ